MVTKIRKICLYIFVVGKKKKRNVKYTWLSVQKLNIWKDVKASTLSSLLGEKDSVLYCLKNNECSITSLGVFDLFWWAFLFLILIKIPHLHSPIFYLSAYLEGIFFFFFFEIHLCHLKSQMGIWPWVYLASECELIFFFGSSKKW
jgi:hypothetical protein